MTFEWKLEKSEGASHTQVNSTLREGTVSGKAMGQICFEYSRSEETRESGADCVRRKVV